MERRFLRKSAPTVSNSGNLNGRAIAYDQWTMIGKAERGGFREKVNSKALTKTVADGDMVLLDNHDAAKPLARKSAGTLTLSNTGSGLDWRTQNIADTTYAQDAVKNAKAGNYGGCSFGFDIVRDKWGVGEDGIEEREILEAKVPEISICTFPAYGNTSVSARDQVSSAMECRARFYEHELRAGYTQSEVDDLGAKGQAFKNPDGHYSYPVANAADLGRAIKAVGRGGASHDAIRKYIIGRAKSLGLSDQIPDSWAADGSMSDDTGKNSAEAPEVTVTGNQYDDMAAGLVSLYNELPVDQRAGFFLGLRDDEKRGFLTARAAKASYADLDTCGNCDATGQYGAFCSNCGEAMSQAKPAGKFCSSCGQKMPTGSKARNADHEHRDSVDGDSPAAKAPNAKASEGQHQDHPPVTGTHTHAGDDSTEHTHNAKNGYDHAKRSEPVTATRDDERRKLRMRMLEADFALDSE